ncbi:hypothetical protein [Pseudooceanicola algae]|uniref:Uncharacterized protein n=1 Tax=Pseudooceanicola algae TaxID=1537215 RepID=A0A418SDM8_9RHOB|nr:hypothetical protein [Pseudooceanicola algae]QPM89430.1 hypothetical protein PSAL_006490 [Pseudooceanicola algae]
MNETSENQPASASHPRMKGDSADPKALIREAFRIEGISDAECRSILMDWALSLSDTQDQKAAIDLLLHRHAEDAPTHPMTALLREGLTRVTPGQRRGGWRARARH